MTVELESQPIETSIHRKLRIGVMFSGNVTNF